MQLTGAQIVIECLKEQGVDTVFGYPGGAILNVYDELYKHSDEIRHILTSHEQGASHAADGYARATGKVGVCLATSGPGATNLVTGIATAYMDSIPVVAITCNVGVSLLGKDSFQEIDIAGITMPITKHNYIVKDVKDLAETIRKAFVIAKKGRPGPVLIDIPKDVTANKTEYKPVKIEPVLPSEDICEEELEHAVKMIQKSKKPYIFVGGGAVLAGASEELYEFAKKVDAPVTDSLMGKGAFPGTDELYTGMLGMHGNHAANVAIHDSDLVIAAGVRFDDRATGVVSKFCPNAKIIHIDIDAAEVDKIMPSTISIVADVESVFSVLTELVSEKKISTDKNWLKSIIELKNQNVSLECGRPKGEKLANPREIIKNIPKLAEKSGISAEKLIITTDVGQHQMWAAQFYPVERPRSFLTSGSLGTMGFGLPAAIGASLANPENRIVCFSGDGSIMMNVQELATLAELNLPVTVIVFENGTLGMVYQQQKFLFDKNYSASVFSKSPDLLQIAKGFGIEAIDADSDESWYLKAFDSSRKNKPCFVRISVNPEETVLPFVPGGKANIDSIRD